MKQDGWNTDPFELVEDEQHRLIGRGATDDKGPILGWINVVDAHQKLGLELPVNLKFCLEGMEESGSEGLEPVIYDQAKKYFADVDAVCISDNYWLGTTKPCLTYGLRGVSYFHLQISGPARDLHSGVFGGTVHEPMTDLFAIMSKLVTPQGKILVPGIYDMVRPMTGKAKYCTSSCSNLVILILKETCLIDAEQKTYDGIHFEMRELHEAVGNKINIHDEVRDVLQHRWRYPSLSLHGVEGAFYSPGDKTVVPAKVVGKFSIRTVPDMDPAKVTELVQKYVTEEFQKLGSKNTIKIECSHAGNHWLSSPDHWNYGMDVCLELA